MKTIKMIYPLAFALAVILAATGCKHQPVGLTKLHPVPTPPPYEPQPNTKPDTTPPGTQLPPDNGVGSTGITAANLDLFQGMIMDRAALANSPPHLKYAGGAVKKTTKRIWRALPPP